MTGLLVVVLTLGWHLHRVFVPATTATCNGQGCVTGVAWGQGGMMRIGRPACGHADRQTAAVAVPLQM
jgi:hypothetical protein